MKSFIYIIFSFFSLSVVSQYTEVINSKRPGYSESPYTIGTGVYQIETGVFYHHNNLAQHFTNRRSIGSDLFLRAGLFSEKLEFSANFKYQFDQVYKNVVASTSFSRRGFSEFTAGAKYMIYMPKYKDMSKEIRSWKKKYAYDWKRLIPGVGIYAGLNTNLLSKDYKLPQISPKAGILLQNDFDEWTTLVTNIYGDYLTLKEERLYGLVTTLTYSITPRFSIFGEYKGEYTRYTKNFRAGGGFAFLANKDLQIGINAFSDLQLKELNLVGAIGLSWRLDRHKDKEIHKKDDGSGNKVEYKEDGFLKRLFSKKGRRGKAPKKAHYRTKRQTRGKRTKASRKPKERRKRREPRKREPRRRRR